MNVNGLVISAAIAASALASSGCGSSDQTLKTTPAGSGLVSCDQTNDGVHLSCVEWGYDPGPTFCPSTTTFAGARMTFALQGCPTEGRIWSCLFPDSQGGSTVSVYDSGDTVFINSQYQSCVDSPNGVWTKG
jgi:hypothetical protein